jgi:flagellar hook protein FlgE
MSINSSMLSGVSALIANSAALGAISDNISNVNTVGYKENETQFEDMVTAKASAGNYNSGGVQANVSQLVSQQGQFTQSSSATDLAINGNGFFVVSTTANGLNAGGTPEFTRAGAFTPDASGNLVNTAGLYLQGWAADSTGAVTTSPSDLTSLSTINVDSIADAPNPTTTASINANLDNSGTTYSSSITVYDGQGGQHTVDLTFTKTAPDTWTVAPSPAGSDISGITPATTTVTFNPSNGSLATPASGQIALSIAYPASSGLTAAQTVNLDIGGTSGSGSLTQTASPSTINSTSVDGGPPSAVTGVVVGKDGTVTADFANGATRTIAQVALATFPAPDQLAPATGNAYTASGASGAFTLKTAGDAGAGTIQADSLESSTVDLSSEFTNLIITQRAYSAASKIISTADQMLQELIAVKQ